VKRNRSAIYTWSRYNEKCGESILMMIRWIRRRDGCGVAEFCNYTVMSGVFEEETHLLNSGSDIPLSFTNYSWLISIQCALPGSVLACISLSSVPSETDEAKKQNFSPYLIYIHILCVRSPFFCSDYEIPVQKGKQSNLEDHYTWYLPFLAFYIISTFA